MYIFATIAAFLLYKAVLPPLRFNYCCKVDCNRVYCYCKVGCGKAYYY